MMKVYSSMIMIAFLGLLTSCGSSKTAETEDSSSALSSIYNKTWHLDKIKGKAINYTSESEKWPSLILREEDEGVSGFAGCNNFMGNLETDGENGLQLSNLASTRMACPNISFNENDYLKILEEVTHYNLDSDILELKNKKEKTILTYSLGENDSASITETYWKLKTLNGEAVEMGKNQKEEVHFTLKNEDHKVEGFSGCNNFMGSYKLGEGHTIEFA